MQVTRSALAAKVLCGLAMTLAIGTSQAQTTNINFDDVQGASAFNVSSALTNQYQSQGVTFSSIGSGPQYSNNPGAAVLNDLNPNNVSQNFGFNAKSGDNFLAFRTEKGAVSQIQLSFASAMQSVSIWALANPDVQYFAAGGSKNLFVLTAFDASNNIVGTSQAQTGANSTDPRQAPWSTWQQLSVSGQGISRVVLNANGNNVNYSYGLTGGYDNLSFTAAIPEPESYALLLAGLGLMGFIARRKKSA